MKIFVDLHHHMLFYSLQLLLEDRLGHELYRPIGEEWFDQGYWKIAEIYGNHPSTIKQFLALVDAKPTQHGDVGNVKESLPTHYVVANQYKDQKALTFQQFLDMDIDVVIASYYPHIEIYADLIRRYKPTAKLVVQMGNDWPVEWSMVKNLMSSTIPIDVPSSRNAVFYHQELGKWYYPTPFEGEKTFRSFVHCLALEKENNIFKKDWQDFQELESLLLEYKFYSYGSSSRDGIIQYQGDVADLMRKSWWGIHLKHGGDGFGHTLHGWFACGRPIIFRGSQYQGKLGERLLKHRQTGYDLDIMKMPEIAYAVKYNEPDYNYMCDQVRQVYSQEVDFDRDAANIKLFFERLI